MYENRVRQDTDALEKTTAIDTISFFSIRRSFFVQCHHEVTERKTRQTRYIQSSTGTNFRGIEKFDTVSITIVLLCNQPYSL